MKIKGLKRAIGDYNRANKGGYYSPRYGKLMFDKSTGEIWCDEFYSLGHNEWKVYNSEDIVNIVECMTEEFRKTHSEPDEEPYITMKTVREFIENNLKWSV